MPKLYDKNYVSSRDTYQIKSPTEKSVVKLSGLPFREAHNDRLRTTNLQEETKNLDSKPIIDARTTEAVMPKTTQAGEVTAESATLEGAS
jgi:hypothetical protein